ncbi:DUF3137 domain-containing protein [Candidatus Dependentiae bacterium]|nr:DUF3137 domain-containing protein [Candidatus Dependentiae bacterium]
MKTIDELKKYYETDMTPEILILEDARKSVIRKLLYLFIFSLILAAVIFFFAFNILGTKVFILIILLFLIICIPGFYFITKKYTSNFKNVVINKIITFIEPNLHYNKDGYINKSSYLESKIFTSLPDRFRGDDHVYGSIDKTKIDFSEIHSEYKTESTDKNGRKKTSWHTIFKGLFFIADFNKNFNGVTVVLPDLAERLFGSFIGNMLQKANINRGQLIKLEDVEFEKNFAVYGDDQIEARYILSTALMKRITDFKKKSKKEIYLSFVSSKIYIAVSYSKNLFEPKVFKSLLDFSQIQEYYDDLQLAIGIVEDLNLNTRIWSKQ